MSSLKKKKVSGIAIVLERKVQMIIILIRVATRVKLHYLMAAL